MSIGEKETIKATILATLISALIIFILSTQWLHHGDIAVLKTNQVAVMKDVEAQSKIPAQLLRIETLLEVNASDHAAILKRLDRYR